MRRGGDWYPGTLLTEAEGLLSFTNDFGGRWTPFAEINAAWAKPSVYLHSLCVVGTQLYMYLLVYTFISMLWLPASDLRAGFIPQLPQGSSFLIALKSL